MFGLKSLKIKNKPDFLVMVIVFVIIGFGLIMLSSASSDLAKIEFGDSYFYLKHQILFGLIPGIILFFLASNFYYQNYKKFAIILFALNILLLILIFSPLGVVSGGATRWLTLGPITFQPSELLKFSFIVYIAAWLSGSQKRKNNFWEGCAPFLIICGLVGFLLLIQPATSTAGILILSALIVYFASGARISYILVTFILGLILFLTVSYLTPYRWQRITSFIDPTQNTQSSSYHINQALIAIGSGNLSGVGFGQSTTKIHYLPEPIGDSIFAVIAEEMGFIGSSALILGFLVLITRIFILARKTIDQFGQLLLTGFGVLIGMQFFVNVGAISGIIPLTGIALPFISYGGTSLAVFMLISGIIINISKYN
ncbi:putative lipid II flippase FtsW [Patescibacteria group bacterium]|nr:putative lipid II flippase FtsW [Patescibacteria group bacterium]